jgi:small subunit ribosomal protein S6
MLERYRTLVESSNGTIHRMEDWGRRQLAFPIAKLHKAHYALMNIECDAATLAELEGIFRFNDAVLRHLTVCRQEAIAEQSLMMKAKEEKDRSSRSYEDRRSASSSSDSDDDSDEEIDDIDDEDEEDDIDDDIDEEEDIATMAIPASDTASKKASDADSADA